jgi:hypothetical protein
VFIAGLVRSGSTLLDLVLGCHPRFVGLGELCAVLDPRFDHLSRFDEIRCSCGVALERCEFWGPLRSELERFHSAPSRARYGVLLAAFRRTFGEDRVLVDSSKTVDAMRAWLEVVSPAEVRVLHLVRDVRSWTVSMIDLYRRLGEYRVADVVRKRGLSGLRRFVARRPLNRFRQWHRGHRGIETAVRRSGLGSLRFGYEELTLQPRRTIEEICRFLDVDPVEEMLSPGKSGSHVALGNRMRASESAKRTITHDARWLYRTEWLVPAALLRGVMRYNAERVYDHVTDPAAYDGSAGTQIPLEPDGGNGV